MNYAWIVEILEENKGELITLLKDVYGEGYMGGINDDKWFDAYAMAVTHILKGEQFSDELVDRCYREINKQQEDI